MTSPAIVCPTCGSTDWYHFLTTSATYRRRIVWDNVEAEQPYAFEKLMGEDVDDETAWTCANEHLLPEGADDDNDRLWELNSELDYVS